MRVPALLVAALVAFGLVLAVRTDPGHDIEPRIGTGVASVAEGAPTEIETPDGLAPARVAAAPDGASQEARIESASDEAPHFQVEGIVLERHADGTLHPAAGRTVRIGFSEGGTTTTGADGRFAYTFERRGRGPASVSLTVLAIEGDPFLGHVRRLDFPYGESTLRDIRVVLAEPPAIVGRVVGLEGEPVAGVRIALGGATDTTGSDGTFDLGRPSGVDHDAPYLNAAAIVADVAGGTLLHAECPGFDADGLWQPMHLVVGPVGELSVRVLGADGAPRPGETVTLTLAPDEPWYVHYDVVLLFELERLRAETDGDGIARFREVPAGLHLALDVLGDVYVDQLGGRVVDGEPASLPIAVPPGGALELEARARAVLRVTGLVREPDGEPSAKARVRFVDVDGEWLRNELRTADDGTFEADVPVPEVGSIVEIVAQSVHGEQPAYGMFSGGRRPDPRVRGTATLVVGATDEPHAVTIDLAPRPNVVGTVTDPDGQPVESGSVMLRLADGRVRHRLPENEWAKQRVVHGRFEFKGVAPGTYVAEVRSVDHGLAVSAPFDAGAGEVEVRFERSAPARILVAFEGIEPGPSASLRLRYSDVLGLADVDSLPWLASASHRSGQGGDPHTELGLPAHRSAELVRTHSVDLLTKFTRPGETVEITTAPGPFVLGVDGVDGLGRKLAPVGIGLVRVAPGEHHVVLAPTPVGTVELTVLDARPGESVEVRGSDGHVVWPVVSRGPIDERTRLSARGSATIVLPAGRHELAIGPPEALERGVARLRVPAEVRAGEVLRIER